MASNDLRPFSYAVLALVGDRGAGAHDMVAMMRRGRIYWTGAESQWYAESKRLATLGLLTARRTPGKTTDRTEYRLTATGRRALRAWLEAPTTLPRIQNEGSVRLLAGDLGDDAKLAASIAALRPGLDELDAALDDAEAFALTVPERTRYLLLNHRLGRRLIAAFREWVDEVEQELLADSDARG